jgi:molecular chaperone Hsp33
MVAASLLSETLKFEGSLTVQARSNGEIPLIMAEADESQNLRAIARTDVPPISREFSSLLKDGNLCITVDPKQGKRYQGIVSLGTESLSSALGEYFVQSEQLRSQFWLYCNGKEAAGFMLQELPSSDAPEVRKEQWEHLCHLASTLTPEELYTLDNETLLYRLYHEETVRLFPSEPLRFRCNCSPARIGKALLAVGIEELTEILKQDGGIEVNCEFCNQAYNFDELAVSELFDTAEEKTLH